MSRIVVTSLMGIDGYAAGRGGDLSVRPCDRQVEGSEIVVLQYAVDC